VNAAEQISDPTRAVAALVLQEAGIHDLGGQVIRCQRGEEVGIRTESSDSLTIANVVIEGCKIGIMITASTTNPSETVPRGVKQNASAHLEGVKMQVTTIGILLAGNGSTVTGNVVGGAIYGIVVTGDDNVIMNNQSSDNYEDGFLVTGDRNLLEGNEARRNGGAGIRIARVVPMVGNRRILFFIQDTGSSNIIRKNTALDNNTDLVEFADCATPPLLPLDNEWTNNAFGTRQPECIQ
jgi:parallel beta-helix repeat protein